MLRCVVDLSVATEESESESETTLGTTSAFLFGMFSNRAILSSKQLANKFETIYIYIYITLAREYVRRRGGGGEGVRIGSELAKSEIPLRQAA